MKKAEKAVAIIVAVGLTLCSVIVAYAADPYIANGSETGNITVKNYSSDNNYAWVRIIDDGIAAWNDSGANVSISTSSSSDNTIEPARYNDTWYGLTTQTCYASTGYTIKFIIQINARTIADDAADIFNFATSTVAHEFGHVFWLCDDPNTTKPSLMKYNRDRNTMTTPQQFDIDNVNAKY